MTVLGAIDSHDISALTALVVAVMTAYFQIRASNRARLALQTDLLMKLSDSFSSAEMIKCRKTATQKLLEGTYPNNELDRILGFFSKHAHLYKAGALSLDLIYALHEYAITRYWHCAVEYIKKSGSSRF